MHLFWVRAEYMHITFPKKILRLNAGYLIQANILVTATKKLRGISNL